MQVTRYCDEIPSDALRAFLSALPADSGVCLEHDPRWLGVLQRSLGHRTFALVAREGDAITGYLPLSFLSSRLFGRFLVSLPYLNRAGVVSVDAVSRAALIDEAIKLAQQLNAQYLELRHEGAGVKHRSITHNKNEKVTMVLDLPQDKNLWESLPSKVRNLIRKADRHDFSINFGSHDLVNQFYDVFTINMRDLGTPVYPRRLFEEILTAFPDEAEFAIARYQGKPVAGALLLHDQCGGIATTQVPSASCLRACNALNANMWMYRQLLQRAMDRGSVSFDFGRTTPGSGTHRFKKQWKAQPRQTVWQYHLRQGDLAAARPENPKMQRKVEAWKKLPVWATRIVGPKIVRGIP